jgi:hypothetical protein
LLSQELVEAMSNFGHSLPVLKLCVLFERAMDWDSERVLGIDSIQWYFELGHFVIRILFIEH